MASSFLFTRITEGAMRHFFQAEQWLPYRIDLVFSFFANPENLPRLMPAWQKAQIDNATILPPPPCPSADSRPQRDESFAGAGTKMTLSFRPFPLSPLRIGWDAEISEFVWNDHFCDIQLRGPFAYWQHCHRLQSEVKEGASGTLLRDEVEYEIPFGLAGDLAQLLFINRQFRRMFEYRHQRTMELLAQLDCRNAH